MAKLNTIKVFIGFILLEFLLLAVSKILQIYVPPIYNTIPLNLDIAVRLTVVCTFALIAILLVQKIPVIAGKRLTPELFKSITAVAIILNLISFYVVSGDARYTSGSLSGITGAVYVGSDGLNLLVFLLIASSALTDSSNKILTHPLVLLFFASYLINVDGLARALTIISVLLVCLRPKFSFNGRLLLLVIIGLFVVWYGLLRKIPGFEISTLSTLSSWVVYRFSINIESMLLFLSDQSIMEDQISAIRICIDSFSSRMQFIFDQLTREPEFKSVSQAIYFDLYNSMDGGSSPGFLYGSFLIAGYFGFIFVMIFGYLLKNYLSRCDERLGLFAILGLLLLFRAITTDIPDALAIVSPSFVNIIIFVFSCFVAGPRMRPDGVNRL